MSFAFRRVVLKDWLAYGGTVILEFPRYEPQRNLVAVHGRNGYGKTSLMRALRFIFDRPPSKDEYLELWHQNAQEEPSGGSVEVSLEFTHRGRQCKIVRGCDFKPRGTGLSRSPRVELFFDGRLQDNQVEDKIQELLPRDCLDLIFFDGAEIVRYAQRRNDEATREAIEKMLGIPAVRNLREDLRKVIKDLESDQQHLLQESQAAQSLVQDIEALEDEIDNYSTHRKQLSEKRDSVRSFKDELLRDLKKIEAAAKDLELLRDKEHQRASLEERIRTIDSEIQSLTASLPLLMLEDSLQDVLQEKRAQEGIPERVEDLKARLRTLTVLAEFEGDCLCGREVGDAELATFSDQISQMELKLAPYLSGSDTAPMELEEIAELTLKIRHLRFDPEAIIDRRSMLATELEEVETEIARLRKGLESHSDVNVSEISLQIGQNQEKIEDLSRQIQSVDNNKQKKESELDDKKRELDQLGAADSQAQGVTRVLAETKRAYAAICEVVERLVGEKRAAIEAHATETFRELTNKPEEYDGLRLRTDYSLEVIRRNGSAVENKQLSAGEKEVVAYSFITALNLSSPDPAPFVMDTPFGHLDSGHRKGLLASLPNLRVQAFLLATDRDLPAAERDAIDAHLAKEFQLKRDPKKAATFITEDAP